MKFYNRELEIESIKKLLENETSQMVYIHWRRRIWKTSLILESITQNKNLYFFV